MKPKKSRASMASVVMTGRRMNRAVIRDLPPTPCGPPPPPTGGRGPEERDLPPTPCGPPPPPTGGRGPEERDLPPTPGRLRARRREPSLPPSGGRGAGRRGCRLHLDPRPRHQPELPLGDHRLGRPEPLGDHRLLAHLA